MGNNFLDKERHNPPESGEPTGQTGDTIRIRKPARVFTNTIGQTVWMGDVEPCELELERAAGTNPYDNPAADDPWAHT